MNAFNRVIMLILALLLIAVPLLLLLVAFGALPANQVNAVTNPVLGGLSTVSGFSFDAGARTVTGIIGAVLALLAVFLLMRELVFGPPVRRRTYVDDTPGHEVTVTSQAVRHLAEGAAREVGAVSPRCSLASDRQQYSVSCDIRVPEEQDYSETAAQARGNIRRVLEEQQVPLKDVEITVQGTAPREG